MTRVCLDCATPVSRCSTGRCLPCANRRNAADPVIVARRAEGLRRRMRADPELRARHARRSQQRLAAWRATPEGRDKLLTMAALGLAKAHTPEAQRKSGATRTANALAWCPPAYRDEYRRLTRNCNLLAADARRIIEAEIPGTAEHARRAIANHRLAQQLRRERELAQAY